MKKFKNNFCLNNEGFAITSIIYAMLLLFVVLMMLTIATLGRKKNILDKSREDTKTILNEFYQTFDYDYTGDVQTFVAPRDGYYNIELWGAQGGNNDEIDLGYYSAALEGGKGAYTTGAIYLEANETIYIYVGGSGVTTTDIPGRVYTFNGGGFINESWNHSDYATGGGATDIRLNSGDWNAFDSLKTRIMVAAGGGGAGNRGIDKNDSGYYYGGSTGGAGGTLTSQEANNFISNPLNKENYGYSYGSSASQTASGSATVVNGTILNSNSSYPFDKNSGFGIGDSYSSNNVISSTGGGGYYGGGGGRHAGGSGGSSFISGYDGCDAIAENSTAANIVHTGQSTHYSGLKFENANMIDGNSYMPTYDGDNVMIGNSGNGHAKITYVGNYLIKPEANLVIEGFAQITLPTITENNFTISAMGINYRLNLPNSGYSFDWNQSNPSSTISFCNNNDECYALPFEWDATHVKKNGTFVTPEAGYIKMPFAGVLLKVNNLIYRGQKVKINPPIIKAPIFSVRSGCTYNSGTYTCTNTHNSGDTANGNVYIFATNQGNFTQQFSIDGGEWQYDGNSANGYYVTISGTGRHTIKVRTAYPTSNSDVNIYSEETDEFIIYIE